MMNKLISNWGTDEKRARLTAVYTTYVLTAILYYFMYTMEFIS